MRALAWLLPVFLLVAGCGDDTPEPLSPTDPAELTATLEDLAAFGEKRVGTESGAAAADYVRTRMEAAGLEDVHFEEFAFPRHDVTSSALALTIDGAAVSPAVGYDVFEGSGAGHADGALVSVGTATEAELDGVELTGAVALVERSQSYHRSTQYLNVAAKGAAAMLYLSTAPDNLRQVGSVRRTWEAMGPIPAITIGADDGAMLQTALDAAKDVHAVIDVAASTTAATGRNVVGSIPGTAAAEGQIVIGAHYDTWFTGSTDNGAGVAGVLALAARRALQPLPRYTLVFVAYDGEEVALYGGYHFLRRHVVLDHDPVLAALNLEMPAALGSTMVAMAHSNHEPLDTALQAGGLAVLYPMYVSLDIVPPLFGGIIPTDIQGIYRSGVPTATTSCDSPYYHTTADTPDKVDVAFLAQVVDAFDLALGELQAVEPAALGGLDPKLWSAAVTVETRSAGAPLVVEATVTDAAGAPQSEATVTGALLYDDFFLAAEIEGTTDASGRVTLEFPAADADRGSGSRFVHFTAGPKYPLTEIIVPVDPQ